MNGSVQIRSTPSFLLLAAVAATFPAFGADTDRIEIPSAIVQLTITPEGRPDEIEIDPTLDPKLVDFLSRAIEGWQFEPATRNGRPATARTTLSIRMSARTAEPDGKIRVQIDSATTGPGYAKAGPPRYPVEALRKRQAGEVVVEAEVDANGRVTSARIARSNAGRLLERSALDAVKRWVLIPETVDGIPIASTALLPVTFCIHGKPCPRLSPDGEPADARGAPIAQSVVARRM
jgi:TonB family protein